MPSPTSINERIFQSHSIGIANDLRCVSSFLVWRHDTCGEKVLLMALLRAQTRSWLHLLVLTLRQMGCTGDLAEMISHRFHATDARGVAPKAGLFSVLSYFGGGGYKQL